MAYAYAQQSMWSSRRLVALLGAVAVNVGMIYAIANGLNPTFVEQEELRVPVRWIDDLPPDDRAERIIELPIPAVPAPKRPDVFVPEPDYVIDMPDLPQITTTPDVAPQPPVIRQPTYTQLQSAGALAPPMYPPRSITLEEQGTVTLLIYVLPDGSVADVKVSKSSGHQRLDQAAMRAALGGWRFKPATQDGVPIAAWGRYAVTFSLRDDR